MIFYTIPELENQFLEESKVDTIDEDIELFIKLKEQSSMSDINSGGRSLYLIVVLLISSIIFSFMYSLLNFKVYSKYENILLLIDYVIPIKIIPFIQQFTFYINNFKKIYLMANYQDIYYTDTNNNLCCSINQENAAYISILHSLYSPEYTESCSIFKHTKIHDINDVKFYIDETVYNIYNSNLYKNTPLYQIIRRATCYIIKSNFTQTIFSHDFEDQKNKLLEIYTRILKIENSHISNFIREKLAEKDIGLEHLFDFLRAYFIFFIALYIYNINKSFGV